MRPRHLMTVAVLATAGLLAAACSSSSSTTPSTSPTSAAGASTLTISDEGGTTWPCDFNPFNSNNIAWSFGPVYEPLIFVNNLAASPLAPGAITPWLATAYKWNSSNTQLTFTIRQGVKWSNGTPMTPADVVFTFDMLKKYKALDLQSLWTNAGGPLTNVVAKGNDVVMTMNKPSPLFIYNIGDQVAIVPQTIWSKIANPVTYTDKNPIGTGAYTMKSCTPANMQYVANPHYYQPGLPKIKTVNYPSYTSNPPANADLASGADQWGSQYIPDIQSAYLNKSSDYHTYSPPIASVSLIINLALGKSSPLSNVLVRQAMAYAYDPAKAKALLEQAGYTKVVGGVRENSAGQKLSFAIVNNGGFSDWIATLQDVVIPELAAVGIQTHLNDLSQTSFQSALYTGHFQLGYNDQPGGPGAFYEFRQWLFSGNTAPIGQLASTNFERYSNKNTDALINEYETTPTSDTAKQTSILNQLQGVFLKEVPVVPVTGEVDWYQWSTKNFTGWPVPPHWYAQPAQYQFP